MAGNARRCWVRRGSAVSRCPHPWSTSRAASGGSGTPLPPPPPMHGANPGRPVVGQVRIDMSPLIRLYPACYTGDVEAIHAGSPDVRINTTKHLRLYKKVSVGSSRLLQFKGDLCLLHIVLTNRKSIYSKSKNGKHTHTVRKK